MVMLFLWKTDIISVIMYGENKHQNDSKEIWIHLHSLIKISLFVINVIQYYKSRSEKIKPKSFCPSFETSKYKFNNITPIRGQTLK